MRMSFVSCAEVLYVVNTVFMSETNILYRLGSEGVDVSGILLESILAHA